jgi:hypothetical protein
VDTSGGDEVLVVNWPDVEGAYHNITNLFDIVEDSGGNPIGNNKWFNLVIWGVANKSGTYEPAMINLPSGFYNTQASAEQDISGFDNFDLPREFDLESSTAFLIARLTIKKQAGTWAFGSVVDLRRGDLLGARGGASSPETEFPDNTFNIFDATDNTKVAAFQVDQVSPGTTRTLTVPDTSSTILVSDGSVPLDGSWAPGAFNIGDFDFGAKPLVLNVGDDKFQMALAGGLAVILFDTNDGIRFTRATNTFSFVIGGDSFLHVSAAGIEADNLEELTADAGVTVDGLLIKDGKIAKYGPHTQYIPLGMDISGAPITP